MHNTASKYFCSVLYFRGCCLVFVTCLVLYLWQQGLRLREAEPLGKTWTGLISRHWGEEKGMTLCEERCCKSMEVIKSWTKTNINGQTWKSTCMIFPAKPGPGLLAGIALSCEWFPSPSPPNARVFVLQMVSQQPPMCVLLQMCPQWNFYLSYFLCVCLCVPLLGSLGKPQLIRINS